MSEELLQQIIHKLNEFEQRFDSMATKDDIANMATKDDIANMATKDDLAATNNELKMLSRKIDEMAQDIARIDSRLTSTNEQVVRNTEALTAFLEIAATVNEHSTDIKLLKKLAAG